MNTFLVPVDFSDTSKNAARFAAHLSTDLDNAHIVLYHVYDSAEGGSDGSPVEGSEDDNKVIAELALKSVKTELSSITSARITCVAEEEADFVECLEGYVRRHNIPLIIMGITGQSRLDQIFMGSNTLKIVSKRVAPVIIVPPDAQYKSDRNIMLISDFKDVEKTIPIAPIKAILNLFKPALHVVNVDSDHYVELTDEYKVQKNKLNNMIKEFKPEYYFIRLYDFMDAINQFVMDKNIDMIMTIPKNHTFLSNVFKTTHTSKLAYHSHVPIIAVHS
jgi:nucleotide-binding universal stress UspA family protein